MNSMRSEYYALRNRQNEYVEAAESLLSVINRLLTAGWPTDSATIENLREEYATVLAAAGGLEIAADALHAELEAQVATLRAEAARERVEELKAQGRW